MKREKVVHRHFAPRDRAEYGTDGEYVAATIAACPTCSRHDHSDKRVFGYTGQDPYREAVPAWWFNCPACGNAQSAQHFCSSWTPEGSEFMRREQRRAS